MSPVSLIAVTWKKGRGSEVKEMVFTAGHFFVVTDSVLSLRSRFSVAEVDGCGKLSSLSRRLAYTSMNLSCTEALSPVGFFTNCLLLHKKSIYPEDPVWTSCAR